MSPELSLDAEIWPFRGDFGLQVQDFALRAAVEGEGGVGSDKGWPFSTQPNHLIFTIPIKFQPPHMWGRRTRTNYCRLAVALLFSCSLFFISPLMEEIFTHPHTQMRLKEGWSIGIKMSLTQAETILIRPSSPCSDSHKWRGLKYQHPL